MADLTLALFILIPAAMVAAYLAPLCRAMLAGLALARDPSVRVTPMNPWEAFDRAYECKIRHWRWIWGGLNIIFMILTIIAAQYSRNALEIIETGMPFLLTCHGFACTLFMSCVSWGPRCRQAWSLAGISFAWSMLLFPCICTMYVAVLWIPTVIGSWLWEKIFPHLYGQYESLGFIAYFLCFAVFCHWLAKMKWGGFRQNVLWFRFEE